MLLSSLLKLKSKPELPTSIWRSGMWVVVDKKIGILNKLGTPCEVHLVDPATGETTLVIAAVVDSLRQARWSEIPLCRRNISEEAGRALGYGS